MVDLTFAEACDLLERALDSDARTAIVADLLPAKTAGAALARLRESMRANVWKNGGAQIALDRFVARYDARTRADGFHALPVPDGRRGRRRGCRRVPRRSFPAACSPQGGPDVRTPLASLGVGDSEGTETREHDSSSGTRLFAHAAETNPAT